jgi:hypothetical protein
MKISHLFIFGEEFCSDVTVSGIRADPHSRPD